MTVFICLCTGALQAQAYRAEARIDSNHMLIGDQMQLSLSISGQAGSFLFPPLKDSIRSLEIVRQTDIDTLHENGRTTLSQHFTLTAFDTGWHEIPAFNFYTRDSQLIGTTQPLRISVSTVEVDTAAAIKGIKAPLTAPLTWKEIGKYALLAIAVILALIGLIWLVFRVRSKQKPKETVREVPVEAAHIIAFQALKALNEKNLWQQGAYKEYYSELTDILREYLHNRWKISAKEMVSDEIIEALGAPLRQTNMLSDLQQTLQLADAVKFAKSIPLPNENSRAFQIVYDLVENTKLTTPEETAVHKENEETEKGGSDA